MMTSANAKERGSKGGKRSFALRGRKAFSAMAKKSWLERPKPNHPKEYYQMMARRSAEAKRAKKLSTGVLDNKASTC